MDNVTFIDIENKDGTFTEFAIIDRGNGEFTSMPKSVYDEQQAQAALSTPMVLTDNYLTPPDTIESTQPDEADLTEGTN